MVSQARGHWGKAMNPEQRTDVQISEVGLSLQPGVRTPSHGSGFSVLPQGQTTGKTGRDQEQSTTTASMQLHPEPQALAM